MILDETWATSKNLEVTVISGNQLPTSKRDMIDPYIVIEVLTPNQSFGEFKTKTIKVCYIDVSDGYGRQNVANFMSPT